MAHLLIFVAKFNYKLQIFETMLPIQSIEGRIRICRSTCLKLIAFKLLDKSLFPYEFIEIEAKAKREANGRAERRRTKTYLRINHLNENLAHAVDIISYTLETMKRCAHDVLAVHTQQPNLCAIKLDNIYYEYITSVRILQTWNMFYARWSRVKSERMGTNRRQRLCRRSRIWWKPKAYAYAYINTNTHAQIHNICNFKLLNCWLVYILKSNTPFRGYIYFVVCTNRFAKATNNVLTHTFRFQCD